MIPARISEDGAQLLATLAAPDRALPAAAERGRIAAALLAATLAALLFAAVAAPRTDYDQAANRALDADPKAAELTPHDRELAIEQARRAGAITAVLGAALGTPLLLVGAAAALWVGFRVAGTRPAFRPTLAVVAHGALPAFLAPLLAIPALLARAPVPSEELPRLLPSSLAALLPAGAPPALAAAAGSFDLFALWTLALVTLGMARAAGATRTRAALVVAVLWLARVAFLQMAPAALLAGAGHGGA